jgi:sugar phosphate isomerase/epimerase
VRQLVSPIFHVHLKDAVGRPGGLPGGLPGETFLFPLLGEGEVPWTEFFAALDTAGYNGFLTVEFESFTYYKKSCAATRLPLPASLWVCLINYRKFGRFKLCNAMLLRPPPRLFGA